MQFAMRFEQQRSKRCKPHAGERSRSSERDYARYGDRMSGRASGADAGGGRVARAAQAGVSRG